MKNENRMGKRPHGYERILNHVVHIFNYDKEKAFKWWMTPNVNLEDKSPFQYVKDGRSKELMRILRKCL